MRIKTLLIAPYPGLKELAAQLAKEQTDLEIIVEQGDLEDALPIVKRYSEQEIDFIVSRGGTAKLIRQHTTIPVVEIQVSGYDILRALTLVKDYKLKVEIIGFPNIIQSVISVARLLNVKIPSTTLQHRDEVEEAVQIARQNGVHVVLGDTITVKTAEKYGLQGMMITSGRESVLEAFEHVRQIYDMLRPIREEVEAYTNVLQHVSDGWLIFGAKGHILNYNQTFADLFQLQQEIRGSLLARVPLDIRSILDKLKSGIKPGLVADDIEYKGQILQIIAGVLAPERKHQDARYYVIFKKIDDSPSEKAYTVRVTQTVQASFAQVVANSSVMKETVNEAKRLVASAQPFIIYGEKGVGKRFFAAAIHYESRQADSGLVEIAFTQASGEVDGWVKYFETHTHATFLIRGIEQLSTAVQLQLAERLKHVLSTQRIVLSFTEHPQELLERGELHAAILEHVSDVLRIPPLRERKEDLYDQLMILIGVYNSRYGKQVVGVSDAVLEFLLQQDWRGNMDEFKDVIQELVRTAQGDYVEREQLYLLPRQPVEREPLLPINLNQKLIDIEKDIIHYVLKEENMNQTKAAQRLGINRTTLWRKLNVQTRK